MNDILARFGLDWTVSKSHVFTSDNVAVKGWRAIRRDDNGKVLHMARKRYNVLQNRELLEVFEPFPELTIDNGGEFHEGTRVYLQATVTETEITDGDRLRNYLTAINTHNGNGGGFGFIDTRVACENTCAAALRETDFRIVHKRDMRQRYRDGIELLKLQHEAFQARVTEYRRMARTGLTREQWEEFKRALVPPKPSELVLTGEGTVKEKTSRQPRAWNALDESYRNAPGATPGNRWGAFNAVTYWLDHARGRDRESSRVASWFGPDAAKVRNRAFELLTN